MHLSNTKASALSSIIRLLADANDGDALREALGLPLLDLLSADQYASMVWHTDTQRFHRFVALNMSAEGLRNWDLHYRFIDPLTFPMMERKRPTLATQVMPHSALSKTEFFSDFLTPEHMYWGVNVFFFQGDHPLGDFRIFRKRGRGNFESEDINMLRLLEPGVTSALTRLRWAQFCAPDTATTESAEELLQRHLLLSKREAEVAWLIASGCPDKTVMTRLTIGMPTVRFHVSRLFEKLHVNNRVALASRVQAALANHGCKAHRQSTEEPRQ